MSFRIGLLTLALITMTACGRAVAPQPELTPANQPAQSDKTPPLQPAHDPTAGGKLAWTYTAPTGVSRLRIVPALAGGDLALSALAGAKESLIRLGPDGKQSAPAVELPGALISATPDLQRFLVDQRTKVVIMDTQGRVLWAHEPVATKVAEAAVLLPGGERVALTLEDEVNIYRTSVVDLTGNLVWEVSDQNAGEVLHATDRWVFLQNATSVWRVNADGTDKQVIIPKRGANASSLISLDGTTVAEERPDGGRLYSTDGKVHGDLPAGEHLFISRDGRRLLLRQGKSTYRMVDQKGELVSQTDLPQDVRASALALDGSIWVAVWRDEGGAGLRAALYSEAGVRLWETAIPLDASLRNKAVSVALNEEAGLAYVVVGNTVTALTLK